MADSPAVDRKYGLQFQAALWLWQLATPVCLV